MREFEFIRDSFELQIFLPVCILIEYISSWLNYLRDGTVYTWVFMKNTYLLNVVCEKV